MNDKPCFKYEGNIKLSQILKKDSGVRNAKYIFGEYLDNTNPQSWEDIHGFFDFSNIYDEALEQAPENAVFVEIGSFKGKSTAYMAEKLKSACRSDILFYAIDVWELDENNNNNKLARPMAKFLDNMASVGVEEYVIPMKRKSVNASKAFKDNSIDFVFIDGDHSYEGCMSDLTAWFPKVKKGGILAGHDYQDAFPGVIQAVDEFFEHKKSLKIKDKSFFWSKN